MKFAGYKFDDKFIVLKKDDINKHLNDVEKGSLDNMCNKIATKREKEGKSASNNYLVVNCDEPYADEIAAIIAENEDVEVEVLESDSGSGEED